jgi:hypothetical protein
LKSKGTAPNVLRPSPLFASAFGLILAACASNDMPPDSLPAIAGAEIETDAEGRCFGRDIAPAVIETVTSSEVDRPAVIGPDGTVISPASYQTVTRQQITRERNEVSFETICPPAYTPEFVSTLQRALAARGFYMGPINGLMDTATGRAVQDFQRQDGPDSPLLAIETARTFGIVALSQEQLDRL